MRNFLTWLSGIYYLVAVMLFITAILSGYSFGLPEFEKMGMSKQWIGFIAALLIMLKYAHLEARYHYKKHLADIHINKISSAFYRLCTMIFLHWIFNFVGIFGWKMSIFISGTILAAFSFWFDIRFNKLIGEKFNYAGTTSVYDRIFGKYNWIIELLLFLAATIIIIYKY